MDILYNETGEKKTTCEINSVDSQRFVHVFNVYETNRLGFQFVTVEMDYGYGWIFVNNSCVQTGVKMVVLRVVRALVVLRVDVSDGLNGSRAN